MEFESRIKESSGSPMPFEDPEALNREEIEKNIDQRTIYLFEDTFKYKVKLDLNRSQIDGLREHVDRSVNTILPNRRRALELFYGLNGVDDPIADIARLAEKLDISKSKVRSLLSQGKRNLRHPKRLGKVIDALGLPVPDSRTI